MSDMTREQSQEMTVLLTQRDPDRFLGYCEEQGFDYGEVLFMLASVCTTMMPKITGDTLDDPDDYWIMEPVNGKPTGSPTPAMQLLVAYANNDKEMVSALVGVIAQDETSMGTALVELIRSAGDLLNIYLDRKREEG